MNINQILKEINILDVVEQCYKEWTPYFNTTAYLVINHNTEEWAIEVDTLSPGSYSQSDKDCHYFKIYQIGQNFRSNLERDDLLTEDEMSQIEEYEDEYDFLKRIDEDYQDRELDALKFWAEEQFEYTVIEVLYQAEEIGWLTQ